MQSMLRGRFAVALHWSLVLSVLALLALAPLVSAAETPTAKKPVVKAPAAKTPVAKAPAAQAPVAQVPAAAAPAADAPKVLGSWNAVAVTPQGELPVVMTVRIAEGQPKCEVEVAGAKQAISDEKLTGDVLTMKVTYEFGVYDVTATASGDTLEGTWQGGGYSGALKGTRRP
jgi:hypothetical protein